MVVKFRTRLTGTTEKLSKKGNPYTIVGFVDGAECYNCILDEGVDKRNIIPFAECDLTLDIKLGKYISVKVVNVEGV